MFRKQKYNEGVKKFKSLRLRLNRFFMNFVTDIILTNDVRDVEALIEKLFDMVVFNKEISSEDISRNMFNSEVIIEPTLTVRSFILDNLVNGSLQNCVRFSIDNRLQSSSNIPNEVLTILLLWRKVSLLLCEY